MLISLLKRYCLTITGLALLICPPQTANAQQTVAPRPGSLSLLTYEVGDLVLDIRDHTADGSSETSNTTTKRGFGGGGGGGGFGGGGSIRLAQRGSATNSGNITMDDVIRVITATVSPTSWTVNGGIGEIQPLGAALVVWQTEAVHKQIRQLLTQLRQGSGKRQTVTVDARWLLLNSDDLDSLLIPNAQNVPTVDRNLLAKFTRRPTSLRGLTSCFSSQMVYLVSGTRKNIVSSYIPVVGSLETPHLNYRYASRQNTGSIRLVEGDLQRGPSGVGYQPIISNYNFGTLLEIRPTLDRDGKSAIVELKSTITVSGKPDKTVELSHPLAPQVDRLTVERQELATTMRIPTGQPTLVGGLTYGPDSESEVRQTPPGAQATTGETPQLYLILDIR